MKLMQSPEPLWISKKIRSTINSHLKFKQTKNEEAFFVFSWLPFFPDPLVIDLLADAPVDKEGDDAVDGDHDQIKDDGCHGAFTVCDVCDLFCTTFEYTEMEGKDKVGDAMDHTARPDVSGLPV